MKVNNIKFNKMLSKRMNKKLNKCIKTGLRFKFKAIFAILSLYILINSDLNAAGRDFVEESFGSPSRASMLCEDFTYAPDPNTLRLTTAKQSSVNKYGPYETFYSPLTESELNSNFSGEHFHGEDMFDVNRVDGRVVIKISSKFTNVKDYWEDLKFEGIEKLSPIFPQDDFERYRSIGKMAEMKPENGADKPDLYRWVEAWLEEDADIKEVINNLNQLEEVEYAEPDFLFQLAGDVNKANAKLLSTNKGQKEKSETRKGYDLMGGPANDFIPSADTDPGIASQWHHDVLNVPAAWNYLKSKNLPTGGSTNTIIAVIDTGVDINHPDLKDNIWFNRSTVGELLIGKVLIEWDEKDTGSSNLRKQQIVNLEFIKNKGNGALKFLGTSESTITENWIVACNSISPLSFTVKGSKTGSHSNYTVDGDGNYTSDSGELIFKISTGSSPFQVGDQFEFRTWAGEIPGNGIDDDGNGYIDDVNGVNVVSDKRFHSVDVSDVNGHGTHVAGAAAAQAGNGVGGVGVAFNAKIMPIRAAQYSGALSSTDISEAIEYAWKKGADVINMSFALPYESMLVRDALTEAFGTSVLVAAAGNYGKPILCCGGKLSPYWPAVYDWVVGVEARSTAPCFCPVRPPWLTTFSNYDNAMTGRWPSRRDRLEYEISVPGRDIYSTWPGEENYFSLDGTSMATGVASGMAALLKTKWTIEDGFYSRFIMSQLVSSSYLKDDVSLDDIPPQDIPGEEEKPLIPYRDTWKIINELNLDPTGKLISLLEGYKAKGYYDFPFRKVPDMLGALTRAPRPFITLKEQWLFDTAAISEINDDDGRIDTGETIEMALVVRNHWGKATDVKFKLHAISKGEKGLISSDAEGQQAFQKDPYVEMLTDEINIGAIGTYCWKDNGLIYKDGVITGIKNPIKFKIKDNTPNDHIIPFILSVECKNGYGPDQGFEVDNKVYKFPEIDKYTMPWKLIIALQNKMRFNLFVQNGEELPKVFSADNVRAVGSEDISISVPGNGYSIGDEVSLKGGNLSLSEGKVSIREAAKLKITAVGEQGSVTELRWINYGSYSKEPSKSGSGYDVTGGSGSGLKVDIGIWSDNRPLTTYNLTNNKYYIIKETVTIEENVILNIEPGTKLQWGSPFPMNPLPESTYPYIRTQSGGLLKAVGTVEQPIEFFYSGYSYEGEWRTVTIRGEVNLSHVKIMNPDLAVTGNLDHIHFDSDTDDKTGKLVAPKITHSRFDFSNWETPAPNYQSPPKIGLVTHSLFDRDHSRPRPAYPWQRKQDWDKSLYIGSIQNSVFLPDILNHHDWIRPHSSTLIVPNSISEKVIFSSAGKSFFFPKIFNGKTYVGVFASSDTQRNVVQVGEWIANHFVKGDKKGHVASINSKAENDFLVDYTDKYAHRVAFDKEYGRVDAYNIDRDEFLGMSMIGLNDFSAEGSWSWSSGEEGSFSALRDGTWNDTRRNVILINAKRSLEGIKSGNFGTWEPSYHDAYRISSCMMILELPGEYSQEELDNAVYLILPEIANKATNWQSKDNAFLIPTWDPEVRNLMQFNAPRWMGRHQWGSLSNNYWGGGSSGISDHVISAMIIDFEEDFNKGKVIFQPKLTTASETAYPHVVDIKMTSTSHNEVSLLLNPTVGVETIRLDVVFNRDMDMETLPFVSFGPDAPLTDFQVGLLDGKWKNARTWTGSEYISNGLNNGYQMVGVWGARAADDKWLVTGYDAGRFRFRVDYGTAESLDLQADGSKESVKLTLSQSDYDLLTGYNIYRSESKAGEYKRVNNIVIPYASGQLNYVDTDVSAGRDYYYKFKVVKTGGEESEFSNVAIATTSDTIPPNVYHVPIETAIANLPLTVLATVIDNKTVYESNLFYKGEGDAEYKKLPMEKVSVNQYKATILGSQIPSNNLVYYIEASDGINKAYANINAQRGGKITVREYHNLNNEYISTLKNSGKLNSPNLGGNGIPDIETEAYSFEWPAGPDPINNPKARPKSDVRDRYGWQILGYLVPPETGDYRFFLASDDNSELYLSTDSNPANAQKIAAESTWRGVRSYPTFYSDNGRDESISREINLQAGRRYYIEAIAKEGGGGDNLAVAWQMPGGEIPRNGSIPISGEYLEPWVPGVGEEQQNKATKENSTISVRILDKPIIFTIDTLSGSDKGGAKVSINGINFKQNSAVFFGNKKATNVKYLGQNQLEVITPAMRQGHYDVVVINNYNEDTEVDNVGIRDSLVVHLPMDGNLDELSGRKNDSYQIGSLKYMEGHIGSHYLNADFNGENSITLMDPSDLDFGSEKDFSISMWVKNLWSTNNVFNATGFPLISNMDIQNEKVRQNFGQSPGWILGVKENGELFFDLFGSTGKSNFGKNTGIKKNEWHHIAVTVDRDNSFVLYVDGSPIGEKIINTEIGSIDSGLFTNIGQSGYGDYMGKYKFKILSKEYGNDSPALQNEVAVGTRGESKVYSQQMDLDVWDSYVPFVLEDGNILVSDGVLRGSARKGEIINNKKVESRNRTDFDFYNTGTIAAVNDESELTSSFKIVQIRGNNNTLPHGFVKNIELNCKIPLKRFSVLVLDNGGLLTLGRDFNPDTNGNGWVDIRNWTGTIIKEGASGRTAKKLDTAKAIKGGEIVTSTIERVFKDLSIDDLGIWTRALPPAQVNAIYLSGIGGLELTETPNITDVKNADGSHAIAPNGFIFENEIAKLRVQSIKVPSSVNRVNVSVVASNVTDLNKAKVTFSYPSNKMVLIKPSIGSALTAWTLNIDNNTAGSLTLNMKANESSLEKGGELISLEFELLRDSIKAGEKLPVKVTESQLNDGDITPESINGIIIIEGGFSISGKIVHWNNKREIPGTIVHLTGQDTRDINTAKSGWLNFTDLDSGQYLITPEKNDDINGISAYDASLIMRHVVGIKSINSNQAMIAADVSGNGDISSLDAFYILDHSVGNRKLPFPGVGKVWAFAPFDYALTESNWANLINNKDNIQLNIYNASLLGQNFEGILLGDVSGDWSFGNNTSGGLISSPEQKRIDAEVLLGSSIVSDNNKHTVRLFVDAGDKTVHGMDLVLGYNNKGMRLVDSESDYAIAVNDAQQDTIKLGIADSGGITGSQIFATLDFEGVGKDLPVINRASINEEQYSAGRIKDISKFDADGDGLLDLDEIEIIGSNHLNKDTDGDGINDYDELKMFSDPLNKKSFYEIRILSHEDGGAALVIYAPINSKYIIESTSDIGSDDWKELDIDYNPDSIINEIPLIKLKSEENRYYRLNIYP